MTVDDLSLTVGQVNAFAFDLKAFHGKTAASGHNDGSNATDTAQRGLEQNGFGRDEADLVKTFRSIGPEGRRDLAALMVLGRTDTEELGTARGRVAETGEPDLDQMLETPASPEYILSGLEKLEQVSA